MKRIAIARRRWNRDLLRREEDAARMVVKVRR